MPRTYKRKLGTRAYKDYEESVIEEALKKILEDGWSVKKLVSILKYPMVHFIINIRVFM